MNANFTFSKSKHLLTESENISIGWIPELFRPVNTLLPHQPIEICEFRFGDLRDDDSAYDLAVSMRCRMLQRLSRIFQLTFFCADLLPAVSSKVRTHKSIFPYNGDVFKAGFEQVEVFRGDKESTLVGAASVIEPCVSECCQLGEDRRRAFFLIDQNGVLPLDLLFAASAFCNAKPTFVNLPYLLQSIGTKHGGIILFGGDNGVNFLNLSVYLVGGNADRILNFFPETGSEGGG